MSIQKVSCIIPAYNEEARISHVLERIIGHPLLSEIIVIDDGSVDRTEQVAKKYDSIKTISHKKNRGKSAAMQTGAKAAKSDILLFLDADLKGILHEDITNMIMPVIDGKVDVTISYKGNFFVWIPLGMDYLSGDRCCHRQLIEQLNNPLDRGYAIEARMNQHILDSRFRFAIVRFRVGGTAPFLKHGLKKSIVCFVGMCNQIFQFVPLHMLLLQVVLMKRRATHLE
jgi:glycosyltransferase involved in cell wall biosynthesis